MWQNIKAGTEVVTVVTGSEVVTEMHIKAGTEVVTEMHIKACSEVVTEMPTIKHIWLVLKL